MKTKLIVTIIIGLVISSGFAFIYNEMSDCLNPPGWLKIPRPVNFSDCLEQFANGNLPHYTRNTDTSSKEIIQIIQVIKPGNETLENFEGVIFDQRLGPEHWYNFFTNDFFKTFNTGTTGITLEGINSIDDLHGATVNISGIRTDRDLGIQVYELQIFDSLIPSSTTGSVSNMKNILNVSLDNLYEDPDSYYNRFIRITGELREHETTLAYAGEGCDTAKYTTSDEFIPDFPSSRQLYVGEKFVGVRIDSHNDLGKVENSLSDDLKNNPVTVMGVFVPNIVDKGKCEHVIHKSGYILTKLNDIEVFVESELNSEINRSCMTLEQSKDIAPFFKVPSYLPEGYSMKCSRSGMPSESYIIYHNKDVSDEWIGQMHMWIEDGAIFILQTYDRNIVGEEKFATIGSAEQRIQRTYDSVMENNPSLNPQLIRINGMLAYAVDSCPDCGMQTADFPDGTSIQTSTATETKIKFIDEYGVSYMLKTTLSLDELILVAESLQ